MHEAGFAQDAEVMRHARFGASELQLATGRFLDPRQMPHDFQTRRVTERVEDALERKLAGVGMLVGTHVANSSFSGA